MASSLKYISTIIQIAGNRVLLQIYKIQIEKQNCLKSRSVTPRIDCMKGEGVARQGIVGCRGYKKRVGC